MAVDVNWPVDCVVRDCRIVHGDREIVHVRLIQNTLTPGSGDEPGFAITVSANGTVSQ